MQLHCLAVCVYVFALCPYCSSLVVRWAITRNYNQQILAPLGRHLGMVLNLPIYSTGEERRGVVEARRRQWEQRAGGKLPRYCSLPLPPVRPLHRRFPGRWQRAQWGKREVTVPQTRTTALAQVLLHWIEGEKMAKKEDEKRLLLSLLPDSAAEFSGCSSQQCWDART